MIQYRTGSPEARGIPDGSTAVVEGIDPRKNLLMIERAGETVSYNPVLLKKRELSPGDRIQFTNALPDLQIREGSFATVQEVEPDGSINAKLDSRKSVRLDPNQAKHIDSATPSPVGRQPAPIVSSSPLTATTSVVITERSAIFPQNSMSASTRRRIQRFNWNLIHRLTP